MYSLLLSCKNEWTFMEIQVTFSLGYNTFLLLVLLQLSLLLLLGDGGQVLYSPLLLLAGGREEAGQEVH